MKRVFVRTGSNEQPLGRVDGRDVRLLYARKEEEAVKETCLIEILKRWTSNELLQQWVYKQVLHCEPERIHLCDGSDAENKQIIAEMLRSKTLLQVMARKNSFLARSTADDVARVESRTFICSNDKEDAGPLNNWCAPAEMEQKLSEKFARCMQGRTMYVLPFSMAPTASAHAKQGVEVTDSPYVVVNMRIMTHEMGDRALRALEARNNFTPCLHSVGAPLSQDDDNDDVPWPCVFSTANKYIAHFPDAGIPWIASFGSGYGGNALLGKKCLALRIASVLGRKEGWLAEHMLILAICPPPESRLPKMYICAAFPSACGKTNLAMLTPAPGAMPPGYKIECLGDDIAWLRFRKDERGVSRLYAVNPEAGFFGVAPGTSEKTNGNAMAALKENCIFTNVALRTDDLNDIRSVDVWWEGMTDKVPPQLVDWQGKKVENSGKQKAAHPNSRFTVPCQQCPTMSSDWNSPCGVPISAIIFGGRRADTLPLVFQSFDWEHGVYLGATMLSEQTAAAEGRVGELRADPMAMRPFIGYNVGDYFAHWLSMESTGNGEEVRKEMPKIFHVNWFRRDSEGKFLWPGFGENARVLQWIVERCNTTGENAVKTAIGWLPLPQAVNLDGLLLPRESWQALNNVDENEWAVEIERHREFLNECGERVPSALWKQHSSLKERFSLL